MNLIAHAYQLSFFLAEIDITKAIKKCWGEKQNFDEFMTSEQIVTYRHDDQKGVKKEKWIKQEEMGRNRNEMGKDWKKRRA